MAHGPGQERQIFDGNTYEAKLIGLEHIVSELLVASLPEDEKERWHPHKYEVFSGELVAAGLPDVAETAFMRSLVNSYGRRGTPGTAANRDGEAEQELKRHRDEHMAPDVEARRGRRPVAPV